MDNSLDTPRPAASLPEPTVPVSVRRRRRWQPMVWTGTAAVALACAFGGGTALGSHLFAPARSSYAAGQAPTQGQLQQQQQWWQQQQQQEQQQQQQQQQGGSTDGGQSSQLSTQGTTDTATASQVKGLVRIQTVLGYDGAEAAGTGMVLTSDGEVVTNHHVVAGATSIKATDMATGKTYSAQVVASDATADVAVIRLEDASGLATVKTSGTPAAVGDRVVAVGDANGTSTLSQAAGRVTALDQSITTESSGTDTGQRLRGLLKITSDVIPGDSGGATYDASGAVVGMTTAASASTPQNGGDVDGYVVPIATVLAIVHQVDDRAQSSAITYGYPAFLGVALGQGGGTTLQGAYADTPAAKAGLAAGDTVTRVDGTRVTSAAQLRRLIAAHQPGDSVRITWTDTSGTTHVDSVTLIQGPVA